MKKKSWVFTSVRKEGYHFFPEAGTDPQFATGGDDDVSFLAHTHQHYFTIKVWVEVRHSNREIEFIQLNRWLNKVYGDGILSLNNQSCEMMAEALYEIISVRYPGVDVKIQVSEDDINGAIVEFTTED